MNPRHLFDKKYISLALQGGGAHGAFTWGVLDRLLEIDEIVAEGICGTSAGAVNAVTLAYGLHIGGPDKAKELLEQLWKQIAKYGSYLFKPAAWDQTMNFGNMNYSPAYMWFNSMQQAFSPYQLNPFNYNPLRDVLLELIDFKEIRHYNTKKLFVCATNVKSNRARVFHNHEITVEAVLASACLPFLFQAVEIDGEYYWDGGYMGNPPLTPLIAETSNHDVVLVKINSINIHKLPITARDIAERVNEISFNSSLINEMHLVHYRNELLRRGMTLPEQNREIFVHCISGYDVLDPLSYSSKLNTSYDFLLYLKEQGRRVADKWLDEEYDKVGIRSTFDIEEHFLNKY
ncbi:MAG: patatin-like phospholipase family protein [Bacteroidetes bacterium]|jgi:NTE family protein|nr:patatin-like phospholipase family protein [Bacteroidota bacterium]